MARRLGEILVEARLLTAEQLEKALQEQRRSGRRLGQVLVDMGLATEEDIALTLARQLGYEYVPADLIQVDPGAARLLPEATARLLGALPLSATDRQVRVAMVDPLNVFALDEIAGLTGREAVPVVVTPKGLERALRRAYGVAGQISRAGGGEAMAAGGATGEAHPSPGARGAAEGRAVTESRAVVDFLEQLIAEALDQGASDIHLEPQADRVRIRFRVDGLLRDVMEQPLSLLAPLVSRVKVMADLDIAERRVPQDGRFDLRTGGREVDVRVSTLPTIAGERVVMRLLDKSRAITHLEQLGMLPDTLEQYRRLLQTPYGMILVTGPTGSGKTTTLMATLRHLNRPHRNILTIEDPVEYHIPGISQVQINPKAGLTFASGLRSFLRQDPDVIMVGEIRDLETAEIAIRAALTGHLVFSTLHTNDAPSATTRLLDMGVESYLVASSVLAVVAQRLGRRICERCREPVDLPADAPERALFALPPGPVRVYRGRGCAACHETGYRGRVALFELFTMTGDLRALVTEKAPAGVIRERARAQGMRTLLEDGVAKALAGITTLEEVQRVAYSEA
ncbi:GspE/PulE family protein [Caldinitratiruptor microaerophilus]|uniref:Type II secretion system protein E n=1 Tax=Caldinitratiruptor microaerophilus TaxID=671077 RepID=A0AA35GA27_9FIRM|nr:ATPase, T2SS/T4P/T4SS family [Caldinitratiruptor microaerophilus]BDG60874.1 type II secretion system protein E [Caldinitratiruptor microaerophilus]